MQLVPVRKANAKKPSESLPLQGSKSSKISNNKEHTVLARKGKDTRKITPEQVLSVTYLTQCIAAERLDISVSSLKQACKKFKLVWPKKFPEEFLSAPVVKQREAEQMNFAEALMRSCVEKQTTESLSEGV
jgi:hypothetical protein